MITKISNNLQQGVAFKGNPLGLVKGELGVKALKIGEGTADSFSKSLKKIVGKDEMPFNKKALTAADHNDGPPVCTQDGYPIEDPDMPGTYIHELKWPSFDDTIEHVTNFFEKVLDFFGF